MNEPSFTLSEQIAAHHAARFLEEGQPQRALSLLREARLRRPDPPPDDSGAHHERQRLRNYIEQAIEELEIAYPGHALRTLRVAMGRPPLG